MLERFLTSHIDMRSFKSQVSIVRMLGCFQLVTIVDFAAVKSIEIRVFLQYWVVVSNPSFRKRDSEVRFRVTPMTVYILLCISAPQLVLVLYWLHLAISSLPSAPIPLFSCIIIDMHLVYVMMSSG